MQSHHGPPVSGRFFRPEEGVEEMPGPEQTGAETGSWNGIQVDAKLAHLVSGAGKYASPPGSGCRIVAPRRTIEQVTDADNTLRNRKQDSTRSDE